MLKTWRKHLLIIAIVLFVMLSSNLSCAGTPSQMTPVIFESEKYCGDGICDGPENALNCLDDCVEKEVFNVDPTDTPTAKAGLPTATPTSKPAVPTDTPDSNNIPPLHFFYVIHTHAASDTHPYTDIGMTQLDTHAADNIILAIDRIDTVLDRYGIKGTYELTYGVAKALCAYQGENHIFSRLLAERDEIAVHAHKTEYIKQTFETLENDRGITADTSSGFILDANRAGVSDAEDVVSLAIKIGVDLGMTVGTENLSPGGDKNPFAEICNNQFGVGNDMYQQSGNLMFPWRPDYINRNICTDNPQAKMTFIDHVRITWTIPPGKSSPSDILTDANFAQLQALFDGALEYMEENRPERVAVWGFVTHITEYAKGGSAEFPPALESLAALDRFLAYVDRQRATGRVVYVTAKEVSDLAFP